MPVESREWYVNYFDFKRGVWKIESFVKVGIALNFARISSHGAMSRLVRRGRQHGQRLIEFQNGELTRFALTHEHGPKRYRKMYEGSQTAPFKIEVVDTDASILKRLAMKRR